VEEEERGVLHGGVAVGTVGGETAAAKLWKRARQRPPLSEGGRRSVGASVPTGSPTDGSRVVFYFSNLPKIG
jgi:hypothetical protein